jgi:hypothetical protein
VVRENIRFQEGNFTSDGTYYYSMLDASQALQQKVDDGSVAFSYPLDTAVGDDIKELHWDGVYFWSLEDQAGGVGFTIRKWAIEAFICKQQSKFDFTTGATHTYASDSFSVENYAISVGINDNGGGGYTTGLTDITVSDTSMMEPGDILTFVRRNTGSASRFSTQFVEQATVQSVTSSTIVKLTSALTGDPHSDGKGFRGPDVDIDLLGGTHPPTPDYVYITKNLWIANDNSPGAPGTPALYKVRSSNGTNVIQFSGTQYSSIDAMEFYAKYDQGTGIDVNATPYNTTVNVDSDAGGRQTHVLMARDSTLLFFNANTNIVDRSMVMNNIKVDTISVWPVSDMVVQGVEPNIVLYRLQQGTTYLNDSLVLTDEAWTEYNYEKQLLRRVVNSIAVSAEPSIIPADGVSRSSLTATLRDQYNDLITTASGKTVNWAEDSGGDRLDTASSPTDGAGQAVNGYTAGNTEQDVKITASVTNGLV